jgi:formylglycine-generating enzyme required for sulfatase activity
MLTYQEWTQAALGSPQGLNNSNLNGWTKTTNTGKIKTAATNATDADADYIKGYNTSLLNVRDCVGNVWEWLTNISIRQQDATSWGWRNVLDAGELSGDSDFGQAHLPYDYGIIALIAGGDWHNGVYAGSRAVYVKGVPWDVDANVGSRFACESL